ncbi:MAG: hypothetical protein GC185_07720 [Alphaproteobacteria bacterium]|nr:hypothetical protein [Alphaproteobacteria bacterium]
MTDWPATLPPQPLLDGYHETLPDLALRTDMAQGPAKLRRRTTAGVAQLSLAYFMTKVQVQVLVDFYTDDLIGGTQSFTFIHPRSGDAVLCRFRQPPAPAALNGPYFRVRVELEVLP